MRWGAHDIIAEQPTVVGRWTEGLDELHGRVAHRFARSEARERARRYLLGLLGRVERKNGWQLAEAIGETDPQGVQRLLNSARWEVDAVRDDLRGYVVEHLGDEETGVLIVDETGFLKKGEKSVGVARQYTGTAGDTVNCQVVGVFLAYASEKGAAFVDRALYLPEAWVADPDRRAEAGVPEEVAFENKIELAKGMLERAFVAGVPAGWVLADSFYGAHTPSGRGWRSAAGPTRLWSRRPTPSGSAGARRGSSNSPFACPRTPSRRCVPRRAAMAGGARGSGLAWTSRLIRRRGHAVYPLFAKRSCDRISRT